VTDLERDVLAHLHANPSTRVDDLAAALGVPVADAQGAIDALLAAGHLERVGARLVPDSASRPSPGLFIASERADARSVERDLSEDER
jgi:DNA-binding Lrp family transcriptional regulator